MSIDWSQVLEKPDKSFKVPGQLLLQLQDKIKSLMKAVDELKNAKSESDQKASSLYLRIETVLVDLESEKKKNNEKEETIEKLKEVVAGLEDNLAVTDEKQKQLSIHVGELNGLINSKDTQISEQANKIINLEAQISNLQEIQSKAQKLENKLSEASSLQGTISEKEAEIGILQSKISELKDKITNLENEKKEFEDSFQKKIEILEEEKNSFEEQYKLKEAEVKEKIEKISEIEAKSGDIKGLQESLAQKNVEISSLQSKVQELEAKLSALSPEQTQATTQPKIRAPVTAEVSQTELKKTKQGVIKSQIPWKSGTGIFVCPDCGSNRTEDIQDKSNVLYVAAGTPIFAKKKRCLNCGVEWNID